MVLTAAQILAFFEDDDQMGIPHATIVQLQQEGITTVGDLADFDKTSLQQVADNLRRPGGRVPDPDPGAAVGATIPTPSFVFGAKSHKRLLVACDLVRYYETVGRDLTAPNLQWSNVMKNFDIQWKALKDRQDDDDPEVPKVSKSLSIMKWTEAFQDFLSRVVGKRLIPLIYVIRDDVNVPALAPPLMQNQPHSAAHGSVEMELVARASHGHALYRDDNAQVYYHIETSVRGTQYASSIKPYQRGKDGRGAWLAIVSQYAGRDKWEAEIKLQEQLLHTRTWKGQSNFPLEHFASQHRNAFVSLQACAQKVTYQLPNEHSRVGYLLDAIQTGDAGLNAAMASIRTDTGATGMRNNFESAVAHLLPYDPVAKRNSTSAGTKRGTANISSVEEDDPTTTQAPKASIGKTGVHFRFHTPKEYNKLTDEQKDELREWRDNNPSAKKRRGDGKKKRSTKTKMKSVASIVNKKVKLAVRKALDDKKDPSKGDDDGEKYIMSLVKDAVNKHTAEAKLASTVAAPVQAATQKVSLQSILKQAKNRAGGSS
jgi:hypothetical protein